MKKICRNCHFLAEDFRIGNKSSSNLVSADKRKKLKNKEINGEMVFLENLKCYHGVWDEGNKTRNFDRYEEINEKERSDSCFFYPYIPGMLFPAAVHLQKRKVDNEELKNHIFIQGWPYGSLYWDCSQVRRHHGFSQNNKTNNFFANQT